MTQSRVIAFLCERVPVIYRLLTSHQNNEVCFRSPAGPRRRRKRTHAMRRASASFGCSFSGDFAGNTRTCCGRGRGGLCFGVWAAVCDCSKTAECVLAFDCEHKSEAFVRDSIEDKNSHIFCATEINDKFPHE